MSLVKNIINTLLFWVLQAVCRLVNLGTQMFEAFSGLKKVGYQGKNGYLMNIFFQNTTIQNIYWGMALIGIALTFAFAIFAVVRKMFVRLFSASALMSVFCFNHC